MNSRSTLHWGKLHEAHRRLYAHVLGAALLNAKSSALRKNRSFERGPALKKAAALTNFPCYSA